MTARTFAERAARRALDSAREVRRRRGVPVLADDRWQARLSTLVRTLDPHGSVAAPGDLEQQAVTLLRSPDDERTWLALAVLSARLPTADEVVDARRAAQLNGPAAILDAARAASTPASVARDVTVLADMTLVDMGDLVLYPLGTGIQRVARNVGRAWRDAREFTAVGWTQDMDAFEVLDEPTRDLALDPSRAKIAPPATRRDVQVVVPWRGTYVLPELAVQPRRCLALQAMARFSPTTCGVIGFDCVPLTSAETAATGFPAVFALNLAAVAEFDVVSTISHAAAAEYDGWRRMLAGAGLTGPRIEPLLLPAHAPEPSAQALRAARDRFVIADMPFVLCVGSHEPRKNHLAVLHAAELLWRRGLRFSLTFVGGNSWNSDEFTSRLGELEGAGRPVESVSRLSDPMLWAAYRLARCTVFPSVNEGFGLPVAESLATGTPAITSDFGSMREIAANGGALLVDPRDDASLVDALERLLVDDELVESLAKEARHRPSTDWDEYAEHLWEIFHTAGR